MRLGKGGDGPWEDRSALFVEEMRRAGNEDVVAAHLNQTFSVQRRRYADHPGIDCLTVRRQNGTHVHPGWKILQQIKDELAPDGPKRFGLEVFPPAEWVIDNHPLWHVWVMPLGWQPGFGFHPDQEGGGLRI